MLFEGKNITWIKAVLTDVKTSDQDVNEKCLAGEVRIVTELAHYPLDTITAVVAGKKSILMPAFQYRHRWQTTKKSRLIEYFILNVPITPILWHGTEFFQYEVMDGLRRMPAIRNTEFGQEVFI